MDKQLIYGNNILNYNNKIINNLEIDPVTTFYIANGLTNLTQITAVNYFCSTLRRTSIWNKIKAGYLLVGGTASLHKWNFKDLRDTDDAFRLTFNGGLTHSSTGILPNGTSGYANTHLIPSVSLSLNSLHFCFYSRTNTNIDKMDMGVYESLGSSYIYIRMVNNTTHYRVNHVYSESIISTTSSLGLFSANRNSSIKENICVNGIITNTNTVSGSLPTHAFYIFAGNNNGSPFSYSQRESAYNSIDYGLTDAELVAYYSIIQNYEILLNRHV